MLNRDNITDLTILIYVGIRSIELNLQRYTDPISYTHTNFMATLHDTRFGSGKHRLLTKKQACTNDSLLNQDPWHRYHYWINRQSSRISWIFCKRLVPLFARGNTCSSAGRSSDDFGRASDSRWITSRATSLIRHVLDRSCVPLGSPNSRNSYATAALAFLPNKTFRDTDFRS